ncbi:UNKNOWN [Stylonychia lemnae]|uniref:Uncharacterized protein n=1 Tax=Stylonychia lemnae TaxID=5949 RepID=A0A078B405_STYLE|nr:UNKNOWN [Stylonychia lemnae]|eukprot:CDW89219.1 UNKNOWN [Stylonychia lemnae]
MQRNQYSQRTSSQGNRNLASIQSNGQTSSLGTNNPNTMSGNSLQSIPVLTLQNLGAKEENENIQRLRGLKVGIDKVKNNIKNSSNKFYETLDKFSSSKNKFRQAQESVGKAMQEQQQLPQQQSSLLAEDDSKFKSRVLPDIKIVEINRMISDPEFIEKFPEVVDGLINGKKINKRSGYSSIVSPQNSSNFDSQNKYVSQTSRQNKSKRNNQSIDINDKSVISKTRDLSFAKLIKKIQESSNALKASKSGKSIFNATHGSIIEFTQNQQLTQSNLNSTTNIPIFTREELKRDFNKLLKLNGPKFQSNNASKITDKLNKTIRTMQNTSNIFEQNSHIMMITEQGYEEETANNKSYFADEADKSIINTLNLSKELNQFPPLMQIQSKTYDINMIQNLQPPIGLTARLSPRQLKEKFRFPEFQNKILESDSPQMQQRKRKGTSIRRSQRSITLSQNAQTKLASLQVQHSANSKQKQEDSNYYHNAQVPFEKKNSGVKYQVIKDAATPTLQLQNIHSSVKTSHGIIGDNSVTLNLQSINAKSTLGVNTSSTVKAAEMQYYLHANTMKELPDVVKYCRKENIAFTDSEKMHYGISMCKKNHRMYANCLKQCFQSSHTDDLQTAIKQLGRLENVITRQQQTDQQQSLVNSVQDLQQYAQEIKQRKQFLKDQQLRESNQRKLINDLQNKIDDPSSNENFPQSIKQQLRTGLRNKIEKAKLDTIQKKKGNMTQRFSAKYDILEKTQRKMERSKNKLSKDLLKVLQKVEIDRPQMIQDKANLILRDQDKMLQPKFSPKRNEPNLSTINNDNTNDTINQSKIQNASNSRRVDQSEILQQLRRKNKRKIDIQRSSYFMLLDYIKLRSRNDRDCRVSDDERKIFDTFKVIFDGAWIIQSETELMNILNEIDIITNLDEQLYFFLWYIFESLSFDTAILDRWLQNEAQIDLSFAKQRKYLINYMIQEQSQYQGKNQIKMFNANMSTEGSQLRLQEDFSQLSSKDKKDLSPVKRNIQEILLKTITSSSHGRKRSCF